MAVTGANLYHLRYKTATATTWTVVSTNLTTYNLAGLSGGTTYNYAVEAVCNSGPSGYSITQSFTTPGVGYCSTGGESTALEYLSMVWMANNISTSQNDNGYADFTNVVFSLTQGQYVSGYLSGKVPYPEFENYSIWIDYNRDGDFTDPGEQVVNFSSDFTGYIAFNFTVPQGITGGRTRMRVTQCYGSIPTPCGVYARGETEDYSVDIPVIFSALRNRPSKTPVEPVNSKAGIYPNPVSNVLYINSNLIKVSYTGNIDIFDIAGRKVLTNLVAENSVNVSKLKTGTYFIKVWQNGAIIYSGKFIKQ